MLDKVKTPVRQMTTEMLRNYLSQYQRVNNCGKVTIDNIRRNLSSFFSWLEKEDYIVSLNSPYERLQISGVEIRLRELGRQLGICNIHPHKFRTMATMAIDKGMPIEQVQKLLGHQQIDTTMQYYGKQVLMESDVLKSA